MQRLPQEFLYLLKNLCGFPLGPNDSNEKIIGVACVPKSPVRRVIEVLARDGFPLFVNLPNLISQLKDQRAVALFIFLESVDLFPETMDSVFISGVFRTFGPTFSAIKLTLQSLDEFVQFMEIGVREDWRANRPLRCAAVGLLKFPVFHQTCTEKILDQVDELAVVDFLLQRRKQNFVIYVGEETSDIKVDQPLHAVPVLNLAERGVAGAIRAESMRVC